MPETKKRTYEADTLAALSLRSTSQSEKSNRGALRITPAPLHKDTEDNRADVVRRLIEYLKTC